LIGTTFNERYRIDEELSKGGMGTVYRAHDTTLERDVALKLLSNTRMGAEGRARLLREAKIAANLHHPNIVVVYDAGEYEKTPYIVMELVEGQTLYDHKPENLEDTIEIAKQICLSTATSSRRTSSSSRTAISSLWILVWHTQLPPE
jgi:serine/threonine protein kinase